MDSTLDGFIESGNAISGEYHDALEIFQLAEEDGYEGVVVEVLALTAFEEYVGFVEEEDGFPAGNKVEDLG